MFPATVTSELSHLKSDINDLKKSTSCILTAVHDLTSMMERSIENKNDRITALKRHILKRSVFAIQHIATIVPTKSDSHVIFCLQLPSI